MYVYLGGDEYEVTLNSGKVIILTKEELEELGELEVSITRREQKEKYKEIN